MSDEYSDIINMPHHVSKNHPQMSLQARAAQFAPFAALTGHDSALAETARLTDSMAIMSDDEQCELSAQLNMAIATIGTGKPVSFTVFVPDKLKQGGSFRHIKGVVKKFDEYARTLILTDNSCISIDNITAIDALGPQ